MISRNSEGGFFAAHWDWLAAGAGLAALAVGVVMFVTSGGTDPDENADALVRRLMADKRSETGVKPVEMAQLERALQLATKPPVVAEVAAEGGSFLVSPKRVFCALCHKPIPGDSKKCPLCKGDQPEPEKVALDTDSDGLPDDWEKKFGLDAATADADADTDADGFTNAEEFAAGTDPSDKKSHPDYFDSLKLVMPLKETYLPFYLRSYMKTPAGMTTPCSSASRSVTPASSRRASSRRNESRRSRARTWSAASTSPKRRLRASPTARPLSCRS